MDIEQTKRLDTFFKLIIENDFDKIDNARDLIKTEDIVHLINHYKTLSLWEQKHNLIQIIQDQYHDGMKPIMLDYLRAPYSKKTDSVELTKAIALSFFGEDYDKFNIYYNNRDLLYSDVNTILKEHGLQLDIDDSEEGTKPNSASIDYEMDKSENQNLTNGVYTGNLLQVKEAIRRGAHVNTIIGNGNLYGMSMLICAVSQKKFEVAKYLIAEGADINYKRQLKVRSEPSKGQTALWWAANHNAVEMVELLIEKGAEINTSDIYGSTPVTVAAGSGSLEALKLLIDNWADIKAKIYDNRSAINLAANEGHAEVVELLIKSGANPDYFGNYGTTPLMIAAQNGNLNVIKVLINNGANVNAQHNGSGNYVVYKGMTPLAFSVSNGFVKASQLLIEAGADVNYIVPERTNYKNEIYPEQRIINLPKGKRKESIRKLLIEYGAIE